VSGEYAQRWEHAARVAVVQFLDNMAKKGLKLVPREPTDEMYSASWNAIEESAVSRVKQKLSIHEYRMIVRAIKVAMYDAAPAVNLDELLAEGK
jgi:hypothetical protein